jgi:D-inositol-3-phosphate glycosyltransferase
VRVALLGPVYPYRGGIAHHTASLFGAFTGLGHDVRVYNFTRQYPGLLFPGQRQTDTSREPIVVPSERTVDSLNPATWVRTAWRMRRFRPDVVVVQWWHPFFAPSYGTIARLVRRQGSSRVVFLCHNVRPHDATVWDEGLLRWAYGAADAFVLQAAVEEPVLRRLVRGHPPVAAVPHPTYDVFVGPGPRPSAAAARSSLGLAAERVLLFFGLVRPYKGLGVLIEAMARLRHLDLALVVAGEFYEDAAPHRRRIAALGLTQRIHLNDRYIPNEQVPQYFAAADLVVLPYLSATQSGIVQIAYAFGVPVVVSAVGGIPEVVTSGETGLLVAPGDPEALAGAIARFFDEDLGPRMRAGIERRRGELTWPRVAEAILDVAMGGT